MTMARTAVDGIETVVIATVRLHRTHFLKNVVHFFFRFIF